MTPLPEIKSLLAGPPCFFCGEKMTDIESGTWKGKFVRCARCVRTLEISPGIYPSAYCWQLVSELVERVEQLEAKYAAQSSAFKVREGDWNRDKKNLAKERQRIFELEKELEKRK